ncbi:unnamed protein product [Clonostachys solani]|uniref:Uncharacterized protein n=1 Tax=Clonostachys solani TaxID=160281 RepID=A0A9N9ZFY7_9HYPO|nr:unnamed protein product [Clonostachys solani]
MWMDSRGNGSARKTGIGSTPNTRTGRHALIPPIVPIVQRSIIQWPRILSRPLRDTYKYWGVALIWRDDLAAREQLLGVRSPDDEFPGVVGNGQGGECVVFPKHVAVPRLDGKDAAAVEGSVGVGGRTALDGVDTLCGIGGLGVDAEGPIALRISVVAGALKRFDDPFRLVGPHGLGAGGARCWAREGEGGREEGEEGLGEMHCDCLKL